MYSFTGSLNGLLKGIYQGMKESTLGPSFVKLWGSSLRLWGLGLFSEFLGWGGGGGVEGCSDVVGPGNGRLLGFFRQCRTPA